MFSLVPSGFQTVVSVVILVSRGSHYLSVAYIVLHNSMHKQSMKHNYIYLQNTVI